MGPEANPQPAPPAEGGWFSHSHLFELARRGRRLTHILGVIPLSIIFPILAEFGALPVLIILAFRGELTPSIFGALDLPPTLAGLAMALFLISAFVLVYVFVGLWVWFYEGRPMWTLGYERARALLRYAGGFAAGILIFAGAAGLLMALGALRLEAGDPSRQGIAALGGVLIALTGWIVQGGAEEVVLRGWALPVLGARYRPWIGLALSSVIFALLHGMNSHLSVLALVNLALFGVFAGLYALREGSIWGISALHSAWNWVQGNILGFEVSGLEAGGVSLWKLKTQGPDWITGGGFGPEGGVAVTAVLLIGIAVILFWPSRTRGS